jgi:MFS transporter, DHA1 family, solute carrier family 18 (vesicular amine transporter), member 1/2
VRRPSAERSAILVVGMALFADTLIYFLLVPLLPGYATRFALGPLGVGLLVWSYSAALLASTLPLSRLLEGHGRRTPMLWGLGLLGATTLLFALGTTFPLLVLTRVLQGVAATLTWVTGMSLLSDCTPPEHRGRSMGTVFAFANLGVVLGPPLSGWLALHAGPRSPFLAAALLVILDGLLRILLLRDPPPREGVPLSFRELLSDPVIRVLAGAMAMGAALSTLLETVLPVHFDRQLALNAGRIGLLFGLMALAHMATSPLMGAFSDRRGRRALMRAGFAAAALLVPASVLAPAWALAGVMLGVGLAVSLVISPVSPAMAEAVEARGSSSYAPVFGILNLSYALGMLVGPFLGSLAQAAFGLRVAMGLLGATFALYLVPLRHLRR